MDVWRPKHRCCSWLFAAALILVFVPNMSGTAGAQLTPIDEEPGIEAPGLGDIVGSPEAGPEPEDAGDRGGWAQLSLAGLLVAAVLFIGSRIRKEARAGRTAAGVTAPNASSDREL